MIPTEIVWTSVHTHDANLALIEATCSLPLQCTVLILPFTPAAKKKTPKNHDHRAAGFWRRGESSSPNLSFYLAVYLRR